MRLIDPLDYREFVFLKTPHRTTPASIFKLILSSVGSFLFLLFSSGCSHFIGLDTQKEAKLREKIHANGVSNQTRTKKRVMILSSTGGGGQTAGAQALKSYLEPLYDVEIVQVFATVLEDFDPIRTYSIQYTSGEDLYNFFLKNGMCWVGGFWCTLGNWGTHLLEERLVKRLTAFFAAELPDIVISVVPFINGVVCRSAQALCIPFAIVSLDLDIRTYLHGLQHIVYEKLFITIPIAYKKTEEDLATLPLPANRIRTIGMPIREAFLHEPQDILVLRRALQLPADVPVVLVLMGAAGSKKIVSYARKLSKIAVPVHCVFCIGRNEELRGALERLSFPTHVTYSIYGFTDLMAELMYASDIIITKSGSLSVCEALRTCRPVMIDHTVTVLTWEARNIEFMVEHGYGEEITSLHHTTRQVERLLQRTELRAEMSEKMRNVMHHDTKTEILKLVHDMTQGFSF